MAAESLQRFSGVGGVKSGAHFPVMDNLINAMAEKEKLYKDVSVMINEFDKKYRN